MPSLIQEGPVNWCWNGIEIGEINHVVSNKSFNSAPFRYENREWFFQCKIANKKIQLWLLPKDLLTPPISLGVIVEVWGWDDSTPDYSKVCKRVQQKLYGSRTTYLYLLWEQEISDVNAIRLKLWCHRLSFRVELLEKNLQPGESNGGKKALRNWADSGSLQSKDNKSKKKKRKERKELYLPGSATASFDADESSSFHSSGNVDVEKECSVLESRNGAVSGLQTELYSKNFTDASVQTSLTANIISSLDSLSEDIAKLLDMDSSTDVELHCEGNTTKAHGALLSVRSPVLAKMLQADMVEGRTRVANIRDMDAQTFRLFLKHLHSGKLEQESLTFDVALRLYEVGDMYEVESLSKCCAEFLFQNLRVENACDVLAVADAHNDSDLERKVTAFILENEIPLSDDQWSAFCEDHPKLGIKVYKMMVSKLCHHGQGCRKVQLS